MSQCSTRTVDAGSPFFQKVVVVFLVRREVIQILHAIAGVVSEGGDAELVGNGGVAGRYGGLGMGRMQPNRQPQSYSQAG
jgi:hypothetical protein